MRIVYFNGLKIMKSRLALAGGWIDQPFLSALRPHLGAGTPRFPVSLSPKVHLVDQGLG
jgi:hypothetical protein